MTQKNIKSRDITFLVIALLCFRIFTNLPMLFVAISGTGAPLSALLCGIVFFAFLFFLTKKQNSRDFSDNPFLRYSVALLFLAYLLLSSVYYMREISEFAKLNAFPTSPLWFIMLFFILAATIGSIGGAESIIRAISIFVPFFLLIITLMIFSVLTQSDASNLFPILGTGASNVLGKGFWGMGIYSDITLLFLLNSDNSSTSCHRPGILWGAVIGIIIIFAIILTFTAKIPYPVSQNESFPIYLLLKEAYFGRFFHRIDALMVVVSSLWGMISLSLNLYFITSILCRDFRISSRKVTVFPVSAIIFFSALICSKTPTKSMSAYINLASVIILCVTALIMIFAMRKGKEKNEG